jgi:hypothetical protein
MTPTEIARRLTPAQKRVVLAVSPHGVVHSFARKTMRRLKELNLACGAGEVSGYLTDTGHNVRAILTAQEQSK